MQTCLTALLMLIASGSIPSNAICLIPIQSCGKTDNNKVAVYLYGHTATHLTTYVHLKQNFPHSEYITEFELYLA